MSSEFVLKTLEALEFTKDLDPEHLKQLASIATFVTFSEGATIFREGDSSELVYLIESGEVSLLTKVPGHGQVTILSVGPGELLGWSSLFSPQRKTAGARTNLPTKAVALNAVQLTELCQADHDLGYAIMWRISEIISNRLRAAREMLLDMFEPSKK